MLIVTPFSEQFGNLRYFRQIYQSILIQHLDLLRSMAAVYIIFPYQGQQDDPARCAVLIAPLTLLTPS